MLIESGGCREILLSKHYQVRMHANPGHRRCRLQFNHY
jgi:hypothetical protein